MIITGSISVFIQDVSVIKQPCMRSGEVSSNGDLCSLNRAQTNSVRMRLAIKKRERKKREHVKKYLGIWRCA